MMPLESGPIRGSSEVAPRCEAYAGSFKYSAKNTPNAVGSPQTIISVHTDWTHIAFSLKRSGTHQHRLRRPAEMQNEITSIQQRRKIWLYK